MNIKVRTEWVISSPMCRQQLNDYDCGAFTCFYAKSLINTYTNQQTSMQDFRDEIFNDLFRDGFQILLNAETLRYQILIVIYGRNLSNGETKKTTKDKNPVLRQRKRKLESVRDKNYQASRRVKKSAKATRTDSI